MTDCLIFLYTSFRLRRRKLKYSTYFREGRFHALKWSASGIFDNLILEKEYDFFVVVLLFDVISSPPDDVKSPNNEFVDDADARDFVFSSRLCDWLRPPPIILQIK